MLSWARVPSLRYLLLLLALNLSLVGLFLWASLDTLTVHIQVEGDRFLAIVNGYPLSATDSRFPSGGGALWLADERSNRNYVPLSESQGAGRGLLATLWNWDLRSNPQAGWKGVAAERQLPGGATVEATGPQTFVDAHWRPTLFGGYRPPQPAFAPFGNSTWQDYTLEVPLLRPRQDAGVLVRSAAPGTGYLFRFRPEHGDTGWEVWKDGRSVETLSSGGFRLPLTTGIKAVLRELLWGYFHALALLMPVLGVVLGGMVWGRLKGRASVPSQGGNAQSALPAARPGKARAFLRRPGVWALLICLLALGATSASAIFLYDRIPHVQDSVTYLFQAETFARGKLAAPAPPLPEFFRQEFILVKDGQWFGKYPPGHPLVLAIGVLAGVPWLVGPLVGSLALGVIYLAGSAMYGRGVGLMAGMMGLLSPFFLFLAASYMAHATELLFLSVFLLGFVKAHEGRRPLWAFSAGLFWGLALMTRTLDAVAFVLPFGLYALWRFAREPGEGLRRYGDMALGAVAPVLLLLWYNWALTGSPLTEPFTLYWDFDRLGFGAGVGGGFGGHPPEAGLMNTWRNVSILLVHLYGWLPYFSLAFACLPFALLKATKWDLLLLSAAVATVGAYVFYWADGIMFGPRYYFSALTAFLLLTARGIQVAATFAVGTGISRGWRLAQRGVVALLVGFLLLGNLLVYLPAQAPVYYGYNNMSGEPLAKVKAAKLTNALVFVEDDPDWQWWKYGALFIGNTPWLDGKVIYARDPGPAENRRLMAVYPTRKAYIYDGTWVWEVK